MRKGIALACAVVGSMLGVAAPASAADTCQAAASWTLTPQGVLTLAIDRARATGTGCAELLPPPGSVYNALGVNTIGLPHVGVGRAERTDGAERGTYRIFLSYFDAVFVGATSAGPTIARYDSIGGCGDGCWMTRGTWTGG